MKKRLLIVAGVILVVALAFGIGFWKEAQATNQRWNIYSTFRVY